MKRRALLATIGAGLIVFLVVLALYLPASWSSSWLPPQVRCGGFGGSIWHGECLGLDVKNSKLGDATWNFSPAGAVTGKLRGDVQIRGGQLSGTADIDTSLRGIGELRNVVARFPLDRSLVPDLPADKQGNVSVDVKRLVLGPNGAARQIDGSIDLLDLREVGAQTLELGSYRVTFDGREKPDGSIDGLLKDVGGPYAVQGTVTITPPNTIVVTGFITGRTAQAESLVRNITLGPPDASGRSEFRFENTF